jgi:hypothetical protein
MRVNGPTRWTSFTPMIDLAEKSFGPSPNDQTILPAGVISMTLALVLFWGYVEAFDGRKKQAQ